MGDGGGEGGEREGWRGRGEGGREGEGGVDRGDTGSSLISSIRITSFKCLKLSFHNTTAVRAELSTQNMNEYVRHVNTYGQ